MQYGISYISVRFSCIVFFDDKWIRFTFEYAEICEALKFSALSVNVVYCCVTQVFRWWLRAMTLTILIPQTRPIQPRWSIMWRDWPDHLKKNEPFVIVNDIWRNPLVTHASSVCVTLLTSVVITAVTELYKRYSQLCQWWWSQWCIINTAVCSKSWFAYILHV